MKTQKRKITKNAKRKAVINITEDRRKLLNQLADSLCPIVPSTTFYGGFSLKEIARKTDTMKYFKVMKNKHRTIVNYLTGLFRYHKQKPKTVILRIVEEATPWLSRKSILLTDEMKEAIASPMEKLGFPIRDKLAQILQPPLQKISIPTSDIASFFDRINFHPSLNQTVRKLFIEGHTNEAIRKSFELFEKQILTLCNENRDYGEKIMSKAFLETSPIIKINSLENANDISEQKGFRYLAMGSMSCFRNILSHRDADQIGYLEALKILAFASYLMEKVEGSTFI